MKSLYFAIALTSATGIAQAQAVVLSQGFDDVAGLAGTGWTFTNNSDAPLGAWDQGNAGVFSSQSGGPDAFVGANFLSTGQFDGAVSNWLISPVLMLDNSSIVSFFVRAAGAGFLDRLEVRMSTSGMSGNVGAIPTSVGDFTTLLGSFESAVDGGWVSQNYSVSTLAVPTAARLAFRYVIDDVSTGGNYIGLDTLTVTAVPEPGSWLLMGLGVAGLLASRQALTRKHA